MQPMGMVTNEMIDELTKRINNNWKWYNGFVWRKEGVKDFAIKHFSNLMLTGESCYIDTKNADGFIKTVIEITEKYIEEITGRPVEYEEVEK